MLLCHSVIVLALGADAKYMYQYLHLICERLLLFLQEINCFLELLFEFVCLKTPCFSILDPRNLIFNSRVSKLKHLDIEVTSIKFWGSRRESRLAFEWYCSFSKIPLTSACDWTLWCDSKIDFTTYIYFIYSVIFACYFLICLLWLVLRLLMKMWCKS